MDKRASYATMIWGVQGLWVNSNLKTREDVAAAALFSLDAAKGAVAKSVVFDKQYLGRA